MQPKNKNEKIVWELHERLPKLSKEAKHFAMLHVGGKQTAYFNKRKDAVIGKYKCTVCGYEWDGQGSQETKCPHCGCDLKVEATKKRKANNYGFFVDAQTCGDWLVLRYYWFDHNLNTDGSVRNDFYEVMQLWYDKDANEVVMAQNKAMYPNMVRCPFNRWSGMSIKRPRMNKPYYYGFNILDTPFDSIYTENLPKHFKYVDWSKWDRYEIADVLPYFRKYPMLEMLLKMNRRDILKAMFRNNRIANPELYFNSIRLAIKNNYQPVMQPKDGDLNAWFDMLPQLLRLGKDWRNPHYVCPPDMRKVHNKYTDIISEMESLEKAAKMEKQYKAARKMFFGLDIGDDEIHIQPLESVRDFYNEWKEMKHCVYSCEYFNMQKHPDSLILSARTGDWHNPIKYLETIEVDIRSFTIRQVHGHCNADSERHQEVIDIVKANLPMVKKVVDDYKAEQAKKSKAAREAEEAKKKEKDDPLEEAA